MELINQVTKDKKNFLFLGEAGSGKSEIAINFARYLAEKKEKKVHFFDMDMTKPLFRSRDVRSELEALEIVFHYEEQFMDAPTLVGGVRQILKGDCFVVMDIGGDYIGARSIGGFAPLLNHENTVAWYVLNAFRPWSGDMDHIDETLCSILGVSHIELDRIQLINNPNTGCGTTAMDFIYGSERMRKLVSPYRQIAFTCIRRELYDELGKSFSRIIGGKPGVWPMGNVIPIDLHLTYPW